MFSRVPLRGSHLLRDLQAGNAGLFRPFIAAAFCAIKPSPSRPHHSPAAIRSAITKTGSNSTRSTSFLSVVPYHPSMSFLYSISHSAVRGPLNSARYSTDHTTVVGQQQQKQQRRRRRHRWHRIILTLSLVFISISIVVIPITLHILRADPSASISEAVALAFSVVNRTCVSVFVAGWVAARYRVLFMLYDDYESIEYKKARSLVHKNAAEWLLWLAQVQGGIYVKAAQHIASLTYVAPVEYTSTLSVLQDRAPFRSFETMKQVLFAELDINDLSSKFSDFDETPVAAASLAQVHRAVTKEGVAVAVKIQYPDIPRLFYLDTSTLQLLSDTAALLFPDFSLSWVISEFRTSLQSELNFMEEGDRCERTQARFESSTGVCEKGRVRCPNIIWDLTGKRVLTMEFVDGVKVNKIDELRAMGFNLREVGLLVCDVFAEMIFCHGVVHCDPHAGNLLVVRSPLDPSKPQLVLLDHGMYRTLDDHFRLLYCNLWKAMILLDMELLATTSMSLGVSSRYIDTLPLMFTGRSISNRRSTQVLGGELSAADRARVKESLSGVGVGDVLEFLEALPRDMLFAMRVGNLVRGIHRELAIAAAAANSNLNTMSSPSSPPTQTITNPSQSSLSVKHDTNAPILLPQSTPINVNAERFLINAAYAVKGSWCISQYEREKRVEAVCLARRRQQKRQQQDISATGATATTPPSWYAIRLRRWHAAGLSTWRPWELVEDVVGWSRRARFFGEFLWVNVRVWVAEQIVTFARLYLA